MFKVFYGNIKWDDDTDNDCREERQEESIENKLYWGMQELYLAVNFAKLSSLVDKREAPWFA